jgi:ubiquinone/menaquinone biosynthesis C-methylase UbiE
MSKDLVKEQFGAAAQSYAVSKVHAQGASLNRLVELVNPQADWQVLDVATGAGHTAFTFAPHVAHVTATDITPEMLATAKTLAQQKQLNNVAFREADAEALPFADATFDLVTCRIAPHHFGDVARFLAESARVLRPGGTLAVVDNIVPGSQQEGVEAAELRAAGQYINDLEKVRDPSHNRCLSLWEWVDAFQTAGFAVVYDEVAPKEIELVDWAQRMTTDAEILLRLREMVIHAPSAVADFLTPRQTEQGLLFYLQEAIIVGRIS